MQLPLTHLGRCYRVLQYVEASALTHASRRGLLGRRSPLLRLQGDQRLIALVRDGQERGFEALVERYQTRLLAFCRGMLGSSEDAEDVLQEVFVAAHKAILADNRKINAKPWLYRIARNRCLNHLRKPVPEGQDSMDVLPHEHGVSAAERAQTRAEFRALLVDVQGLPETQRTALLLREIDALAYEEIAMAMETTVPAVKSLLVRARMSLADCSQGRHLTCDEVNLELAEASEGLRKASGPARAHLRDCDRCRKYRSELRRNGKALAALAPIGPLAALQGILTGKLSLGGAKLGLSAGSSAGTGAGGGAVAAAGGGGGISVAGAAAASGALGTKAAAGFASVALLAAGAVEVKNHQTPAIAPTQQHAAVEAPATFATGPASRAHDRVAPSASRDSKEAEGILKQASADEAVPAEPVEPTAVAAESGQPDPAAASTPEPAPTAVTGDAESGTGSATGGVVVPGGHPPTTNPPPVDDPPPVTDPAPVDPAPTPPLGPPAGGPPGTGPPAGTPAP